jgi:hypothetical protein
MQSLATSITAVLALGLVVLASSILLIIHRNNRVKDRSAWLVWRISGVLLAWVLSAGIIFGTTGP